ncbi:class I SAM-dependent methyltransferase [Micromonospora echinospora]|uniref:class I SAM-dependent methyltransferase n=1 Tax=Micromonospora echinospora TaxID=1877 RepID=UPI0037A5317B
MVDGRQAATAAYHRPKHWDQVHHSAGSEVTGRAWRSLHSSAMTAVTGCMPPGGTVLDLACGTGGLLRRLPAGHRGVGMDFSAGALRHAVDDDATGGLAWVRGDAHQLPLATGSCDAVVCLAGLWVFADPARVLAEAHRVLRPGGALVAQLWASPGDCRLITLGAVAIGRVVPAARLTEGVTGPFELSPDQVGAWARSVGFGSVNWRSARYRCGVADVDAYWAEFAALAPTAYDRYVRATAAERRRVRGLLAALLHRYAGEPGGRDGQRSPELSLTWRLGVARRGGAGDAPPRAVSA